MEQLFQYSAIAYEGEDCKDGVSNVVGVLRSEEPITVDQWEVISNNIEHYYTNQEPHGDEHGAYYHSLQDYLTDQYPHITEHHIGGLVFV